MKSNAVYKRSFNRCLDLIGQFPLGAEIGSEAALARELEVSRTTVRAVQAELQAAGLVAQDGRARRLLRLPEAVDYFPDADAVPTAEFVERRFMAWMLGPDCRPGQAINGLDLARQFGVSASVVRDCLNRLSHFGLLGRQAGGRWMAIGLDMDFVTELFDMREMMEFRAVDRFVRLAHDHPAWAALDAMEAEHIRLGEEIEIRFKDFSALDEQFHLLVGSVSRNRFFSNIQGVMSLLFHYHYQWNKHDERERNEVAVQEHLACIAGLRSRDPERARTACQDHLRTARKTLLASLGMSEAG